MFRRDELYLPSIRLRCHAKAARCDRSLTLCYGSGKRGSSVGFCTGVYCSGTFHESQGVSVAVAVAPSAAFPRMELPSFKGSEPRAWIARAAQFFLVHRTPMTDRVGLALVAMSGNALYGMQWMLRRFPDITWSQFTSELLLCFDDGLASTIMKPWELLDSMIPTYR